MSLYDIKVIDNCCQTLREKIILCGLMQLYDSNLKLTRLNSFTLKVEVFIENNKVSKVITNELLDKILHFN